MEKQSDPNEALTTGELYLFHADDARCPSESSLWGIFDKREDQQIRLESSSRDLCTFHLWQSLPPIYRFSRQATRSELRDYIYNLAVWESRGR